ncbi:MAG TPA: MYXO-CTERM sorting domain-containing protein [Kofleriaceae bacterium]|jgi:uncharacterized protein (TIGR03382 family)
MKLAWISAVLLAPASAFAFSDPATFADTAINGGGGGRYFTGSRAEGYSCSACHQGGPSTHFVVDPLPNPLVAGTQYKLVVHWTDPTTPQALQLEISTTTGANPTVSIPAATALPAESRCDGSPTGLPAVYSVDVGTRRIIGVEDCGASRVEVSFVATGDPIEVSIGGVLGNGDGTANGDGVFDDRFRWPPLRQQSATGCSSGGGTSLLVPAVALLLVSRRRRRSGQLDTK